MESHRTSFIPLCAVSNFAAAASDMLVFGVGLAILATGVGPFIRSLDQLCWRAPMLGFIRRLKAPS